MSKNYYKMMYTIETRYAKKLREENAMLRNSLRVCQDTLNSVLRMYGTMADCQGAAMTVRVVRYSTGYNDSKRTTIRTGNKRKHRR